MQSLVVRAVPAKALAISPWPRARGLPALRTWDHGIGLLAPDALPVRASRRLRAVLANPAQSPACAVAIAGGNFESPFGAGTLGLPEIDVGLLGGGRHARRLFGHSLLRRMMLTGYRVPGPELFRLGIV